MGNKAFKVGDLVRVLETAEASTFIFRPYGFPFGKVGLVIAIEDKYKYYDYVGETPDFHPYIALGYDHHWFYDDHIIIFVEGKKHWVYKEEIEKYNNNEKD
jgi:hypothetical protein